MKNTMKKATAKLDWDNQKAKRNLYKAGCGRWTQTLHQRFGVAETKVRIDETITW